MRCKRLSRSPSLQTRARTEIFAISGWQASHIPETFAIGSWRASHIPETFAIGCWQASHILETFT